METGATYSPSRKYRYELWRIWDARRPNVMFIGLNPSTANETENDPTIRRCIGFAHSFECGGLVVCNLFAYCATDTREMLRAGNPVGHDNDAYLISNAKGAGIVIAAWGNYGRFLNRSKYVAALIPNLYCLKLNASGEPSHPLYLPKDAEPTIYTCHDTGHWRL
jgi:hypothetical protein